MNLIRILMVLVTVGVSFSGGAAQASAQVAAKESPPNILFIIFDDWGGSTHSSIAGNSWIKTPNFDRVAREGVLFRNAFTSNPKCS
ncbi:MAG TPA: sulfatase-like hydrolase/transferase, partial [Opitutaceae bacterium]|nr:sulfatase-like hydrolase/transferase [Opitutaceae bacterium]